MAFRWHSPLVSQEGIPSQAPSKAPPPPPPEVHYDPAQQRAIRGAHAAACEAIECFAVPDASGKANNPATIITCGEIAGLLLQAWAPGCHSPPHTHPAHGGQRPCAQLKTGVGFGFYASGV